MLFKINDLIKQITKILVENFLYSVHAAELNSWFLLEKLTGKTHIELIVSPEITLSQKQITQLDEWLKELTQEYKPLQYILGTVPFLDAILFVKPPVLIPRPETEEWCASLLKDIYSSPYRPHTILDLCTGSGCIAIALAQALPDANVYATDISEKALIIAQKNATYNKVSLTLLLSDLYTKVPQLPFDLIVANPPYIDPDIFESLESQVKNWEDPAALCAAHHGLAVIEKIITQAPDFLAVPNPDKKLPELWIEIGYDQGEKVKNIFLKNGFSHIEILKDLNHQDRVVKGKWINYA